jgi:hypothetical protein
MVINFVEVILLINKIKRKLKGKIISKFNRFIKIIGLFDILNYSKKLI